MNENAVFLLKLIEFIDEYDHHLDGQYKAAMLKTAAAYYEGLTQAEVLTVAISKALLN